MDAEEHASTLARLQGLLGAEALAELLEEGGRQGLEQVVELACDDGDRAASDDPGAGADVDSRTR